MPGTCFCERFHRRNPKGAQSNRFPASSECRVIQDLSPCTDQLRDRLAIIVLRAGKDKLGTMALCSTYDLVPHGKHIAAILALDETKLRVTHWRLSGRWSGVIHS